MKFTNEEYPASVQKALQLRLDGRYSAAIRILKAYLRNEGEDADVIYELARTYYYRQHKEVEAVKLLNRALEIEPDNVFSMRLMAEICIDNGRGNEALTLIERAISSFGSLETMDRTAPIYRIYYDSLRTTQWYALRSTGLLEAALELARELAKDSQKGLRLLGQSLVELSLFEEAEAHFAAKTKSRAQAFWLVGSELVDQERYAEAVPYFLRRLSFARLPDDQFYFLGYAHCLLLAEKYDDALLLASHWLTENSVKSSRLRRALEICALLAHYFIGDMEKSQIADELMRHARKTKKGPQLIDPGRPFFDEMSALAEKVLAELTAELS